MYFILIYVSIGFFMLLNILASIQDGVRSKNKFYRKSINYNKVVFINYMF